MSATAWPEPSWTEASVRPTPPARLRVLVVDEREVVGWGFRLLLARRTWVERCVTARGLDDALDLLRRHEPHLVLVDLDLARRSSLADHVGALQSPARIVLTSGEPGLAQAELQRLGAHDLICTTASARDLVQAVERSAAGLAVWGANEPAAPTLPALSRREQEILELMSEGETNREIAARLFLSPYTVKQHTTAVYRKLGVRNRTEAAQQARRIGLIA